MVRASIRPQLLKQLIIVYQAHMMHFQRTVQQNNENLAPTKQCFIVGKNLLSVNLFINQQCTQLPSPEASKGLTTEPISS